MTFENDTKGKIIHIFGLYQLNLIYLNLKKFQVTMKLD